MNSIKVKRITLEYLEKLMADLESYEDDIKKEYIVVGKEEEQARNWKTDELLWEDEEKTIPKYRDKYDYVPKKELNENDKINLEAINTIKKALEKLV
jgi:hypothetical protein